MTDNDEGEREAGVLAASPGAAAVSAAPVGLAAPVATGTGPTSSESTSDRGAPTVRLGKGYVALIIIAMATLYLAWIAPGAYSLAVRVDQLDSAAKNTALSLAVGIPGVAVLLSGPLLGVISDRTPGRFGRRRPFVIIGAVMGLLGAVVVGGAPTLTVVVIGWTVGYVGYAAVAGMITAHLGDRLPESQRGKVAGLVGAITQVAPIAGVVLAGAFSTVPFAMLLVPAALAFIGSLVFGVRMKDPALSVQPPAPQVGDLARGFWFNPRRHPAVGWVWISRAFIFLALTLFSVYTVFLLSERLGLASSKVAGIVATAGVIGVAAGVAGALLSGSLSDRWGSRKPFLFASSIVIGVGMLTISTMTALPQFFVGSLITVFGIGVYSAVDQATMFDVLPQEEGQNGRYLAIMNLANGVSQAVGPFIAGGIVLLAGGSYGALYVAGAVVAVIGGLLILPLRLPQTPAAPETSLASQPVGE